MDAKTSSLEKQKKGNLYVYKFSPISTPGGRTPDHHPPAMTKKIIPASMWGLTKSFKSKSKPKPKPTQNEVVDKGKEDQVEKGNVAVGNVKAKESEMGMGMGRKEGRKSVSSVEGILLSLASGNGRKSVSGLEEEIKGKGFPLGAQQEGGGTTKKAVEGGRKSVSHVENNVAYVGKFVEKPRKSTGAKLETNYSNVESAMALLQVKVLVTDMPGFMQLHASQCARKTYDSLEKFSAKHMAFNLKKEFDKVYGPAWHCIVGSSFGSFVTHSTGCFLYFSMEKLCILLFRTKVQRALQQ